MADRRRQSTVNRYSYSRSSIYTDGSSARRLDYREPVESTMRPEWFYEPEDDVRTRSIKKDKTVKKDASADARRKPHKTSEKVLRNREKQMRVSFPFVIFIMVIAVFILYFGINYLRLKAELTAVKSHVASLERSHTELKEDNDAYEAEITNNVDQNLIKKIAVGRLGMKPPREDQVMTYSTLRSSFVRQYQDLPES